MEGLSATEDEEPTLMEYSLDQSLPVHPTYPQTLGPQPIGKGVHEFRVWASRCNQVELELLAPVNSLVAMQREDRGYWACRVEGVEEGQTYFYRLNGQDRRPDPASRMQPEGVHQPSAVVATDYAWQDQGWRGLPFEQYITYELHVGTFSPEGTFAGVIQRLPQLVDLGVTAIELLPVSQFPGKRNWGYDGVHPFAAQNSYGGPQEFCRLVDHCHQAGLAVILDVVYNHLGPEGNYLGQFADYFTSRYHTPWGDALNFDGPHSDQVRRFFIENALYWLGECHVDALRLDAVHAIFDQSAYPFLEELADAVRLEELRTNRQHHLIAESHLNDPRYVRSAEVGGWGLDSQWADDLHHAIHTTLTGERTGYYQDYDGFPSLARAMNRGFVVEGERSRYRQHRYGRPAEGVNPKAFTVFAQNHDQVGNRLLGDRLHQQIAADTTSEIARETQKLAASLVLLSPYSPLLFMGEEYGETAPFQYFVSHLDEGLVEAVRSGRKREFASFGWEIEPPDPQAESTFEASCLNHNLRTEGWHHVLWRFYQRLIAFRRSHPAYIGPQQQNYRVFAEEQAQVLDLRLWTKHTELIIVYACSTDSVEYTPPGLSSRAVCRLASENWLHQDNNDEWQPPNEPLSTSHGEGPITRPPRSVVVWEQTHQ